jgi:hypothetical protein
MVLIACLFAAVFGMPVAAATPGGQLSCSDVGGVFVAHGTDGRGDCEPADQRSKCHTPPAEQDGNYLANLTMDPPFPNGALAFQSSVRYFIQQASNSDCWTLPPG